MEISTEGVLVIASSKGLASAYKSKEFDYSFPEGLSEILSNHVAIALQTSDGDELVVEFEENETDEVADNEIVRYLKLQPEDKLLVLSHADFTMICDQANGDINKYGRTVEKLDNIEEGLYEFKIKVFNPVEVDEDEDDEDAEEEGWFFRLSVSMKRVEAASNDNEVVEISG